MAPFWPHRCGKIATANGNRKIATANGNPEVAVANGSRKDATLGERVSLGRTSVIEEAMAKVFGLPP